MTDTAHRNWFLQNRLLLLAIAIVVAAIVSFALTYSSHSSSPTTTASTTTSQSSGACTKGGSCGYDNVTPANAVEIIASQTTGPGSLTSCTATNGEAAALKGTGSSEWDCINGATGETATYTINADGSVDY